MDYVTEVPYSVIQVANKLEVEQKMCGLNF